MRYESYANFQSQDRYSQPELVRESALYRNFSQRTDTALYCAEYWHRQEVRIVFQFAPAQLVLFVMSAE